MTINRIQFELLLSLTAFLERYGTEALCEASLAQARWPERFLPPSVFAVCVAMGEPHCFSELPIRQ